MPSTDSARSSWVLASALGPLRARQWAHFALLPFAGLGRFALTPAGVARGLVGVAAAAGALGFAYGLNAVADRASDASVEKNPLAGVRETPTVVWAAIASSAAVAAAAAGLLGTRALVLIAASLVAGTVYSVGARFKARPFLGLVFNTLIFAPLLGVAAPSSAWPPAMAVLAVTFVGILVQSQLLHESADVAEDTVAGARTTARVLGPRGTILAIVAVAVVFAGIATFVAASRGTAILAVASLAAGAVIAVAERDSAQARRLHRVLAGAAGGILFLAGLSA